MQLDQPDERGSDVTPEEKEKRKAYGRDYYHALSPEDKAKRLARAKELRRAKRAAETPEEREERLAKITPEERARMNKSARARRAAGTPEKKAARAEYNRSYRAKYQLRPGVAEKARESAKQWRLDNPERAKATADAYRKANPQTPEQKAREAQRYQEDKENRDARNRKWVLDNPERAREIKRKHIDADPERRNRQMREWAKANPEKRAKILHDSYERNKRPGAGEQFSGQDAFLYGFFWVNDNGEEICAYIGKTLQVEGARLGAHKRDKPELWDHAEEEGYRCEHRILVRGEHDYIQDLETKLIKAKQPMYNIVHNH